MTLILRKVRTHFTYNVLRHCERPEPVLGHLCIPTQEIDVLLRFSIYNLVGSN